MTSTFFRIVSLLFCFVAATLPAEAQSVKFVITTDYGTMKGHLYDDTPKHKENFIKLAREKFYDGQAFHRVIADFMIQAGDPASKTAKPGVLLGTGGPSYTVPAEINPNHYHKKGALAAARQPDQINPQKASSGSQFYIVQGKKLTEEELQAFEAQINQQMGNQTAQNHFNAARAKLPDKNDPVALQIIREEAIKKGKEKMSSEPFRFEETKRNLYKSTGGTPHLDGGYTVFGEITSGFEVLDKIAATQTDKNDRPLKDIKFSVTILP